MASNLGTVLRTSSESAAGIKQKSVMMAAMAPRCRREAGLGSSRSWSFTVREKRLRKVKYPKDTQTRNWRSWGSRNRNEGFSALP